MRVVRNIGRPDGVMHTPDTMWRPGRMEVGTVTWARATPSAPTTGAPSSQRSMPRRAIVPGRHVASVTVTTCPGSGVGSSTVMVLGAGG